MGKSDHYEDKEDVWTTNREYWNGSSVKTTTELPDELIKKVLAYSSKEDDLVMDPFLGSGQIAVVNKMQSRRYVGFEIVPEYYKFALARLMTRKYRVPVKGQQQKQDLFSQPITDGVPC